jgi:hypothetical protein
MRRISIISISFACFRPEAVRPHIGESQAMCHASCGRNGSELAGFRLLQRHESRMPAD